MKKQEPAFPVEVLNDTKNPIDVFGNTVDSNTRTLFPGMNLRDYFAAKAMQGILASGHACPDNAQHFANIAEDAYTQADAMLAERAK